MKSSYKIIAIPASLIVLVAGLLIWLKFQHSPNREERKTTRTQELVESTYNIDRHAERVAKRAKEIRTTIDDNLQFKKLQNLSERWLKMGTGENENAEELALLSKESVSLLGCSNELIELIDLLNEKGIWNKIEIEAQRLFDSDRAGEARIALMSLPDKNSKTGENFRQRLSYYAGASCTAEEIDSFRAALGSKPCSLEALFGYNRELAAIDPESAVRSTLLALGENIKSPKSTVCLYEVMSKIPDNANFEEIEKLLPGQDPKNRDLNTPVNRGRIVLLKKWAHVDPAGAANYIMEDFQRFSPQMIAPIAAAVTSKNYWSGKEWVQTFPEGPYYDAAAEPAIRLMMFGHTDDATMLAEKIGNPALKVSILAEINAARDNGIHLYEID